MFIKFYRNIVTFFHLDTVMATFLLWGQVFRFVDRRKTPEPREVQAKLLLVEIE